jgi:hypothetical protein
MCSNAPGPGLAAWSGRPTGPGGLDPALPGGPPARTVGADQWRTKDRSRVNEGGVRQTCVEWENRWSR